MIYQRIVCFRFKAGTPEERIRSHMQAFARLGSQIQEILGYQGGLTIPGSSGQPPYDSLHYLTFRSLEDIPLYEDHPAHRQFMDEHRDLWAEVLVLISPVEMITDSPAREPEFDEY